MPGERRVIHKTVVETGQGLVVQVRFLLPDSIWADRINLVGDFNDWNRDSHPMQRDRDGGWYVQVDLEPGRTYQFRYLCDGERWMNDTQADGYTPNAYGTDNFIISTAILSQPPPGNRADDS